MRLGWPGQNLTDAQIDEFFAKRAPRYLFQHERYLRPSVEGDLKPAPSPLMTWWLLLYSFSMLARYQPAKWVALLNPDKSKYAVSLEYALSIALDVVPHLVLEALDRKPVLLARPMRMWHEN